MPASSTSPLVALASAGWAFSMDRAEVSSSMPPPAWKLASEMPKNSMIFRPNKALSAMTMPAVQALTRMVLRRCWRLKAAVKWMKKGTTPTGLTMASSATRGL